MTTAAHAIHTFKRSIFITLAVLVSFSSPLAALAATVSDPSTCPTPASQSLPRPNGADSSTFKYDCDSGMWVNGHYSFNPNNGVLTSTDPIVYTYNSSTGQYDRSVWLFNAPSGSYVETTMSVAQPPSGATTVGGPVAAAPVTDSIKNTGTGSTNTINDTGQGGTKAINTTGANSNNAIDGSTNNNIDHTNSTNAQVINNLTAGATTGNSLVLRNTTAGNALTGNAQDIANVVNLLQSSSSALNGGAVTFVANIDGDVNGDLLFDPASLGAVQSAAGSLPAGNNNLKINNTANASLTNNINIGAQSGTATASENTTAGNVQSGNAQAVANVVNLINSAIGSGKSFIGTININGNLNGDILVPQYLIDQLIASNVPTVSIDTAGAGSTNTINRAGGNNLALTNTNNLGINNNVTADAKSGDVTSTQNTTAGNAQSGNATTHITAFNLTGSNVIGSNALLVFVNVLGTWVGMIVNAPAGSTAAGLGSGVSSGGGTNNTTINNANTNKITNNITAAAKSGDATANANTTVGDVKSGNAGVAVNLLNVENSHLSLSGWFGILFINVFGSWHGSFGVNTSAGDPTVTGAPTTAGGRGAAGSNQNSGSYASPHVFAFVPSTQNNNNGGTFRSTNSAASNAKISNTGNGSSNSITAYTPIGTVLAASITPAKAKSVITNTGNTRSKLFLSAIGVAMFALYFAGERLVTRRTIK